MLDCTLVRRAAAALLALLLPVMCTSLEQAFEKPGRSMIIT